MTVAYPAAVDRLDSAERADPRHHRFRVGFGGDNGENKVRRADRVGTGPKVVSREQPPRSARSVRG